MARTYITEFPSFAGDDACVRLLQAGWRDDSWHNDACPSFLSPSATVKVFVAEIDPSEREVDCGGRFSLYTIDADGEIDYDADITMTDDLSVVLARA